MRLMQTLSLRDIKGLGNKESIVLILQCSTTTEGSTQWGNTNVYILVVKVPFLNVTRHSAK